MTSESEATSGGWVIWVEPSPFSLAGGVKISQGESGAWGMTTVPAWPGNNPESMPVSGTVWAVGSSMTVTVSNVVYTFTCNEYDPAGVFASGTVTSGTGQEDGTWSAQAQTGSGDPTR